MCPKHIGKVNVTDMKKFVDHYNGIKNVIKNISNRVETNKKLISTNSDTITYSGFDFEMNDNDELVMKKERVNNIQIRRLSDDMLKKMKEKYFELFGFIEIDFPLFNHYSMKLKEHREKINDKAIALKKKQFKTNDNGDTIL